MKSESEYKILKLVEANPNITQREIAKHLCISLGKTHYVVKALVLKGFVKFSNFRNSDNKVSYTYFLTPKGIFEKSKLTKEFLESKIKEYNKLEEEIHILQKEKEELDKLSSK